MGLIVYTLMTMAKITTILISVLMLLGTAHAQKMYKWVDEQGNVFYQDQPPPGADSTVEAYAEDSELVADEAEDKKAAPTGKYPVTLFSIPVCDACDLVRNMLRKNSVPFTEKDANNDAAVQNELMKISGQLSVPLLAVGPKVVYGYNSMEIAEELTNAGYLRDEKSKQSDAGAAEAGTLTPQEVEQQAALAGAEFASELEELELDNFDDSEVVEEIPEDEQIKIRASQ